MNVVTRSRTVAAARNNASWCDAVCRAHGIPGELRSSVWLHRGVPPPYYSNLVVVADVPDPTEILAHVQELIRQLGRAGWSIKDSFSSLDLGALGFRLLFEASWIWLDPRSARPGPRPASRDIRWSRVSSPAELARWEAAWSGDDRNPEAAGKPAQFPPALLADPDIAFFSAHEDRDIVGGGIANRADGIVGLSNVFTGAADPQEIWSGLSAIAGAAFPGLPLAGYERGASLGVAASCDFMPIGPLRVWVRDS